MNFVVTVLLLDFVIRLTTRETPYSKAVRVRYKESDQVLVIAPGA